MTGYRCVTHGTEHVVPFRAPHGQDLYRCMADTSNWRKCMSIALPPPPTVPMRRRLSLTLSYMIPPRAVVEWTMVTLVVGFWIGAAVWLRIFL